MRAGENVVHSCFLGDLIGRGDGPGDASLRGCPGGSSLRLRQGFVVHVPLVRRARGILGTCALPRRAMCALLFQAMDETLWLLPFRYALDSFCACLLPLSSLRFAETPSRCKFKCRAPWTVGEAQRRQPLPRLELSLARQT